MEKKHFKPDSRLTKKIPSVFIGLAKRRTPWTDTNSMSHS